MEEEIEQGVKVATSPVVRWILIGVGTVSLVLGIAGIVLPLLPTTPFLLLSAACYARSSRRFYEWLLGNRYFGQYIRDWREGRGVPMKAKVIGILSIVVVLGSSIVFFVPLVEVKLLLAAIGLGVIVHLIRLPTRVPDQDQSTDPTV